MRSIKIKYIPPSATKPSRMKATLGSDSHTQSIDNTYNIDVNARLCAEALLDKKGMWEHKMNMLMSVVENSKDQVDFYVATLCPLVSAAAELLALVCSVRTKKRVYQLSSHIDANVNPYKREEVLGVLDGLLLIGGRAENVFKAQTTARLNALDEYLEVHGLDYTAPDEAENA